MWCVSPLEANCGEWCWVLWSHVFVTMCATCFSSETENWRSQVVQNTGRRLLSQVRNASCVARRKDMQCTRAASRWKTSRIAGLLREPCRSAVEWKCEGFRWHPCFVTDHNQLVRFAVHGASKHNSKRRVQARARTRERLEALRSLSDPW